MRIGRLALLCLTCVGVSGAQTPTGSIAGIVCDPSGDGVPGAKVEVVKGSTGLDRRTGPARTRTAPSPSPLARRLRFAHKLHSQRISRHT